MTDEKHHELTRRVVPAWNWVTRLVGVAMFLALQGSWSDGGHPEASFPGVQLPHYSLDARTDPAQGSDLAEFHHLYRIPVLVTGYSSTPEETDEDPFITASNKWVQRGYIALSRDLLRPYTPGAPFTFGDRIEVLGVGTFQVEDTMNPRYRQRADIWFENKESALRWGSRRLVLGRVVAGPLQDPAQATRAERLPFMAAPSDRGPSLEFPKV